jgi:hypothetical protein
LAERAEGFHRGWWIMSAVVLLGLIPNYALIYMRRNR